MICAPAGDDEPEDEPAGRWVFADRENGFWWYADEAIEAIADELYETDPAGRPKRLFGKPVVYTTSNSTRT